MRSRLCHCNCRAAGKVIHQVVKVGEYIKAIEREEYLVRSWPNVLVIHKVHRVARVLERRRTAVWIVIHLVQIHVSVALMTVMVRRMMCMVMGVVRVIQKVCATLLRSLMMMMLKMLRVVLISVMYDHSWMVVVASALKGMRLRGRHQSIGRLLSVIRSRIS